MAGVGLLAGILKKVFGVLRFAAAIVGEEQARGRGHFFGKGERLDRESDADAGSCP